MFTAAPLRGMNDQPDTDHLWFLARQDVTYLSPVTLRKEPFAVRTGIARMGNTSLTVSSQVDDPLTGTICARAAAVIVFADATGRPTPLTDQLRQSLGLYRLDPA